MLRLATLLCITAACGSSSKATSPNRGGASLEVREDGVGPINRTTKATLEAVKAALPGYDVTLEDTGLGIPDFRVSRSGDSQMIIVGSEAGTVSFVLATSPQITSSIGLRVNDKITSPTQFHRCECVADGLTCFTRGSHIGAMLDEDCAKKMEDAAMAGQPASGLYKGYYDGDPASLAKLVGRTVRVLKWSAYAFDEPRPGSGPSDDPPPPEEE